MNQRGYVSMILHKTLKYTLAGIEQERSFRHARGIWRPQKANGYTRGKECFRVAERTVLRVSPDQVALSEQFNVFVK